MKRVWEWLWRVGVPLGMAAAVAIGACRVPSATWMRWGGTAARVILGLSHPQESLAYMEQLANTAPDAAFAVTNEADASVLYREAAAIPARAEGGDVKEIVIGGDGDPVSVKNNSGVAYDTAALLEKGSPLTEATTTEPRVLIVHTHGCECYMRYYAGYYNHDDPTRTDNRAENVTAVGAAIAGELRAQGIGVIHDTTLHDSPAYTGAYARSEQTIRAYLERYPTIEAVMDIHRDAMMQADNTKLKPTVTVQGRKAAQVMAVVGGTDTPDRPNAYCEENLRLALAFHQAMEQAYPSIMRPVYVVDARYNQGLKAGSMLLEIGTDANTLSEAIFSGELVGKQLGMLMT